MKKKKPNCAKSFCPMAISFFDEMQDANDDKVDNIKHRTKAESGIVGEKYLSEEEEDHGRQPFL